MITYPQLWQSLTPLYEASEAQAIVRLVLDVRFGLSLTDIICGKVTELSADEETELGKITERLHSGEPVQYILGEAEFGGRTFHVEPGVLIPRPETAELVSKILADHPTGNLLDICTGSGCIAISLALALPHSTVTAWDISDDALRIAIDNAQRLNANVRFEKRDALHLEEENTRNSNDALPYPTWDLIVSNPPYICNKEKASMSKNVLDYEPSIALFVPDDDPLVFYRSITAYGAKTLKPNGSLYFEINPLYAVETVQMMEGFGFSAIELMKDMQNKDRMIKATKL